MNNSKTFMSFPCDFTLKIIGLSTDHYLADISAIILKHFPDTSATAIVPHESSKANYCAISATVYALNQPSLDALYEELSRYPGIKMVL